MYTNETEKAMRMEIYLKNLQHIVDHNSAVMGYTTPPEDEEDGVGRVLTEDEE